MADQLPGVETDPERFKWKPVAISQQATMKQVRDNLQVALNANHGATEPSFLTYEMAVMACLFMLNNALQFKLPGEK